MRCTQQSISLTNFGEEALGAPMSLDDSQGQVASTVSGESDLPCAKLKMTGSGDLFSVPKPVCRIGQDPSNDVVLSGDQNVARYHAQIVFENDEYVLRDLGTREGTTLNGQKLAIESSLYDGDHVKIGSFKFYFISDLEV